MASVVSYPAISRATGTTGWVAHSIFSSATNSL